MSNPRELADDADYVFVGRVLRLEETVHLPAGTNGFLWTEQTIKIKHNRNPKITGE